MPKSHSITCSFCLGRTISPSQRVQGVPSLPRTNHTARMSPNEGQKTGSPNSPPFCSGPFCSGGEAATGGGRALLVFNWLRIRKTSARSLALKPKRCLATLRRRFHTRLTADARLPVDVGRMMSYVYRSRLELIMSVVLQGI